ncbi:MAG: OB-fold nucleic acid binding domain-containing protein [Candidatus Kariarchaeaceae archaeon]
MTKSVSIEDIIEIIVKETQYTPEKVKALIAQTVENMDNMVNEEGAAYVVANDLGVIINYDQSTEAYKIDQLIAGQSNVTVIGKVSKIFGGREFTRKDNTPGRVRNLEIVDHTGSARVVLWDNKVSIIEEKNIEVGKIIRINGAGTKIGYNDAIELSLSSHGVIDVDVTGVEQSDFPEIKSAELVSLNSLIKSSGEVTVEGKIIDRQGIVEFDRAGKIGKVTSVTIKDLTGKVRITFWDDLCDKAEPLNIDDVIQVTDVRVGENKYGEKELTFNPYSKVTQIENHPQLSSIELQSTNILDTLSGIKDGMENIVVTGKVVEIGEVRVFERDGRANQVVNITIADNTLSLRVSLWGELSNQITDLQVDQIIRIHNGQAKFSNFSGEVEISCGTKSSIELSPADVNPDLFQTKFSTLSNIETNRSGISLRVQITKIFDEREIDRKDGTTTRVLNCSIIDEEGSYGRIAAWGDDIEKLSSFEEGDGMEIVSARGKPGSEQYGSEITITSQTKLVKVDASEITPLIQSADKLQQGYHYQKSTLETLSEGARVEVKGTIVTAFKPVIYDACSQCSKKVLLDEGIENKGKCPTHGEVKSQPKMILTIVIDDTDTTCTVKLFDQLAEKTLGMNATDARDMIERLSDENAPINKSNIIMSEVWIKGKVVRDEVKETLQINAHKIDPVEIVKETDAILDKFE